MEEKNLVHNFSNNESPKGLLTGGTTVFFLIVFVAGSLSGYLFLNFKSSSKNIIPGGNVTSGTKIEKGQTFGSADKKTFKDQATGVLKTGGIDGEGEYHLVRPGGDAQNVYLTSSVMDLSQFVGKKVKVWGQTNAAKKAGWLMDVGRLQVE